MQGLGPVHAKSMFGGHGLFIDGLMFGLIADGVVFLKVDKENEPDFIDNGLDAFIYMKKDKAFKMSYYQAPEESLEDGEVMAVWANKAYSAALRVAAKKPKK